jgi:hypothetical protein
MCETYSDIYGKWSIKDLRKIVSMQPDFKAQKSRLHEAIEDRGHLCRTLAKFHCETNYKELYFCKTKERTRKRAVMTYTGLKESMWNAYGQPDSLDDGDEGYVPDGKDVCLDPLFLQRASRKVREHMKVYYLNIGTSKIDAPTLRGAMRALRLKVVNSVEALAKKTKYARHLSPKL